MKKLISIFLLLATIASSIISCKDELPQENESSSSSQSAQEQEFPYIDNDGYPVFRKNVNTYQYINVQAKEELPYQALDTIIIDSFQDMRTFMLQNLNQSTINRVEEALFESNVIIAVYRDNSSKLKEYYCYADITPHKTHNNLYTLNFEYINYADKGYTLELLPCTFDLVIIPLSEMEDTVDTQRLAIDIREHKHIYSSNIYFSNEELPNLDISRKHPTIVDGSYDTRFETIKKPYSYYSVVAGKLPQHPILIDEYDGFLSILKEYTGNTEHSVIVSTTFDEYAVLLFDGTNPYKHYGKYGDVRKTGDYYTIDFEYMVYPSRADTDDEKPNYVDFVLIPKAELALYDSTIEICVRSICYSYEYQVEYSFEPF